MMKSKIQKSIKEYAKEQRQFFKEELAKHTMLSNLCPKEAERVLDSLLNLPIETIKLLANLARQSQGARRSLNQWS